jgi:hypothetical protein|tara:strand:+ start:548 stop:748 length:201 start_codon:yes stop_codon:yes gene_type:complete
MDAIEVASELAKHEAVCAERWKTAFNRFDSMDTQINRIETIMISCAAAIIIGGMGVLVTIITMHTV